MGAQTQQVEQATGDVLEGLGTAYMPAPTGQALPDESSTRSVPRSALPSLYVRRGPQAGQRFVLDSDITTVIGRHGDCPIVLSDVTVSRRHAEIRPEGDGFVLADLGSLNGSYVNRKPVDTVRLVDGDEIAMGVFRLVFHGD